MTRRTVISVDEDLLAQVRHILGTKGVSDTVRAALEQVRMANARHRFARRMSALEGLDLDKPEVMQQAWRT